MGVLNFLRPHARRAASFVHDRVFDENWQAASLAVLSGKIKPIVSGLRTSVDLIEDYLNQMEAALQENDFNSYREIANDLDKEMHDNLHTANLDSIQKDDLIGTVFEKL
jgi:hypothetical protein